MDIDQKIPNLRHPAPAARGRRPQQPSFKLSLSTAPLKSEDPQRNPDPYNSSGSFDRTKNWARVGKR
jgi:hypothetical protein